MERFGLTCGPKTYNALVVAIQTRKAEFLRRISNSRTLWRVSLPDGSTARAVYSSVTKDIVTLLKG